MKAFIGALFITTLVWQACAQTSSQGAQAGTAAPALHLYQTLPDAEETKLLRGIITKADILTDTSFGWYQKNLQYFKPNTEAVAAIKPKVGQVQIVLFAGTWCHDSQQILPKYLSTLEAAGFNEEQLTIIACDRAKTTIANLHRAFNITNVPTLVLLKNGKEVGRIVEYGNTALMDAELATLFKKVE